MHRLHLKHNLRTAGFLLIVCGVVAAAGVVGWANLTGMPESWRRTIEAEISKHGAHVEIGSLSYIPFKGLIASDVRVFSDPARHKELSRVERLILDFDKTKLARGDTRLNKIDLSDATLRLPVDPESPDAEVLEMTHVNGTILMRGGRVIEVRNARGKIAGIHVTLGARMLGYRDDGGEHEDDPDEGKRRELISRAVKELANWSFDEKNPPSVRIFIEGDLNDRSTFLARFSIEASRMEKEDRMLTDVSAEAVLDGEVLTFTSIAARDSQGDLDARVDYDMGSREGRFDAKSSLELPHLLKAWLGFELPGEIEIAGAQTLEMEGDFSLPEDEPPVVKATGFARCDSLTARGVSFHSLETAFSVSGRDFYLRDFRAKHRDGAASGKLLLEDGIGRLKLSSSLPPAVYEPFFRGQHLERVLADFSTRNGAEVDLELEGQFNIHDHHAWAYTGRGAVKNLSFRGVPVNTASSGFSLSHYELDFFDGAVEFNYDDYAMRKAYNGPRQGALSVKRVRFDAADRSVAIEGIAGNAWAAPVVRMFAVPVAETLEQYRFQQPPSLKASGKIDVASKGRTSLNVSFTSRHPADYTFLGETLTLDSPSGRVVLRGERVSVEDLKLSGFGGPVAARFTRDGGRLAGEMSWTRLSLPALASVYGFQVKGGGDLTGRIEFSMTGDKVSGLNATGLMGVDKAELFSVPMFGPLTPLVSGVLNDPKGGSERAKSAFFTFGIKNGILSSNDFHTTTTSLVFTGDGTVDLGARELDMIIRMNARGFLGLITLPLRSLRGLFQFHGTGPLEDPVWEKVRFTPPPENQAKALMEAPRARIVVPD